MTALWIFGIAWIACSPIFVLWLILDEQKTAAESARVASPRVGTISSRSTLPEFLVESDVALAQGSPIVGSHLSA